MTLPLFAIPDSLVLVLCPQIPRSPCHLVTLSLAFPKEIPQDRMGGIIQRLQVTAVDILFKDENAEIAEEALRVAGTHHQVIFRMHVNADHVGQVEKGPGHPSAVVAADPNGERVIVQEVSDLREGADGGEPS